MLKERINNINVLKKIILKTIFSTYVEISKSKILDNEDVEKELNMFVS